MEENFSLENMDNLIIKDRNYYCKRRKKIFLILLILIIIIAVITGIVFLILFLIETFRKKGGKIICQYNILNNNENIHLKNIANDLDYNLIIDDIYILKILIMFLKKLEIIKLYFISKVNL